MRRAGGLILVMVVVGLCIESAGAVGMQPSVINQELTRVRYSSVTYQMYSLAAGDSANTFAGATDSRHPYRSPGKAFVMSLVVPGLGQWYYGSKVKAIGFAGIEAALWVFHFKYHSDGNKATTAFEEYNLAHWHQSDYETYLNQAYGVTDDDSLGGVQEISHHLPSTHTGQYYEMTGKYDQFSWGWDDAVFGGNQLGDEGFTPSRITGPEFTPTSSRRLIYENMRHDANNKFDKARAMVFGALINHVASAFEAFVTTKRHNHGPQKSKQDAFSSKIDISARLKSVYSWNDTPCLKVTLKLK
ncbi:MAG: hypothetical protein WAU88_11385 [Candidatus Zixiibacteriota bacterium]